MEAQRKITIRNLSVFCLIVLLSGWAGYILNNLMGVPHEDSLGMLLWLLAPLLTAVGLRVFGGDGWEDAGLKPMFKGNLKWYMLALLIFPVLTLTCVFIGYSLGYITLKGFSIHVFLQAFAVSLIPNFFKNIPEEFVWRGYLTPKLASLNISDVSLYLVVGLVWGVWHVPYYLYFLEGETLASFTSIQLEWFIPLSVLIMMAWTIVFVEIWLLTKSIWPAVLMHMVEDAFVNPLVLDGSFTITGNADWLIHPAVGILSIMLYTVVGLGLRRIRLKRSALQAL